ncbi:MULTISPECIES: helix-turn-helix domain-containing protein [Thermoanaerobacter]|uniref:Transcriptional regulator n=2 Tax=Thermoanaerobacter TaxID=1754 RepID=A0ABT9M2P2_9THEO|nr:MULTISPECIES: helix-turn-helix domain-containing protein [Thermoanaerobacter]MDP9750379.1 putative transcriptional regulator [Thermoanaerobacter pentosaceus]
MSYPEIFKREIKKLYLEGNTQKEIAALLNCSTRTVKRILKSDTNYNIIKQEKKEKSKVQHKEAKLRYKKEKQEEEERLLWGMMEQQGIHAQMISKKKRISTAQLVELSLSQYVEIDEKLRYIDPHHKPADLPRTYNPHNIILPQFRDYANEIESEKWNSKVEEEALK